MTTQHRLQDRPSRGLAAAALLTALAFGCTTIRAPAGSMSSPIPIRDGSAEPQLELWLESARPVTPEEAARVSQQARAVLEAALAGREVGDGSTVLVVREQGVTRTASHRRDQTTATIGLVLGAVVVVVGVVYLLSKGGSGSSKSTPAAPARGFGRAGLRPPPISPALPVAHGARPPPLRPGSPRPAFASPRPRHHVGAVAMGLDVQVGPLPLASEPPPVVISSREIPGPSVEAATGPGEAEPPPAAPITSVVLPPLAPFPLEERGFFAGDALVLELTLVDRLTGEPRWVKWVEEEADPCDQEAVREVLDRALAEPEGWLAAR